VRSIAAQAVPISSATAAARPSHWRTNSVTPAPATIALIHAIMVAAVVKYPIGGAMRNADCDARTLAQLCRRLEQASGLSEDCSDGRSE
jgi:hypothetical protein